MKPANVMACKLQHIAYSNTVYSRDVSCRAPAVCGTVRVGQWRGLGCGYHQYTTPAPLLGSARSATQPQSRCARSRARTRMTACVGRLDKIEPAISRDRLTAASAGNALLLTGGSSQNVAECNVQIYRLKCSILQLCIAVVSSRVTTPEWFDRSHGLNAGKLICTNR